MGGLRNLNLCSEVCDGQRLLALPLSGQRAKGDLVPSPVSITGPGHIRGSLPFGACVLTQPPICSPSSCIPLWDNSLKEDIRPHALPKVGRRRTFPLFTNPCRCSAPSMGFAKSLPSLYFLGVSLEERVFMPSI